jgi:hypothetical protein
MVRGHAWAALIVLLLLAACSKETPSPTCLGAAVVCAGSCAELKSDNLNCGACGTSCAAGKVCSSGACVVTCAAGQVNCGGSCIEPGTDRSHCGASAACSGATAGVACASGELCSAGQCGLSCQAGLVDCNGQCTDPLTDPDFCGASASCTGGAACGPSASCYAGLCEPLCSAGQVMCHGGCINPLTDNAYCGASAYCAGATVGTTCSATQSCVSGVCNPPPCTWQEVLNTSLASLPLGATTLNGGSGSQGPATVAGRQAWKQTSDWNELSVPMNIRASDDVFAVQVDMYIPTPPSSQRDAGVRLFNTLGLDGGTHGVRVRHLVPASPPDQVMWYAFGASWAQVTSPSTVSVRDQWRTVRIEGQRSTCSFRAMLDSTIAQSWSGTCDLAGGSVTLDSTGNGAFQPADVAWSNLRIFTGSVGCLR